MPTPAADPDPRDGLLAGIDDVLTPWAIWAAHFAFSYLWLAVSCPPAVRPGAAEAGLVVASLVAVAALAWRIAGAWRSRRREDIERDTERGGLRLASALLALVATAWTTLPMLLTRACGG